MQYCGAKEHKILRMRSLEKSDKVNKSICKSIVKNYHIVYIVSDEIYAYHPREHFYEGVHKLKLQCIYLYFPADTHVTSQRQYHKA
jgi:hypothetical protein